MSIYPRVVRHSYPYYLKKGRYIIEPQLSFKGGTINGPSGNVFFTVKTKRNLILKAYLHYDHGQLAPINPPLLFILTEGDTVYFDHYTDNLQLILPAWCYINK